MSTFNFSVLLLKWLSSLKLTFILLLLLLSMILVSHNLSFSYVFWLSPPFTLLALNLIAAIICNKAFQKNLPLLLFHLALLATVLLVALSRLTYLDGWVELYEGETFNGRLDGQEKGLLHHFNVPAGAFTNLAVQLNFTPQVSVTAKRSRVLIADKKAAYEVVIGEHKPLVINNYRFYTTDNIGYSALFTWQAFSNTQPANSLITTAGMVNFPSFLDNAFNQANEWQIPGTQIKAWVMLKPASDILAKPIPTLLTPPKNHHVVVRVGEQRQQLVEGQQLHLTQGTLTYRGLRVWMGYQVHYDPYKSYLLAVSVLTVIFLSWFFWQKFTRKSWLA